MTEKRFSVEKMEIVSDHLSTRFFIVDTETEDCYDVQHIISKGFEVQYDTWAEKIADKLNEQDKIIQELEYDNGKFIEDIGKLITENEQLKSEIDKIKHLKCIMCGLELESTLKNGNNQVVDLLNVNKTEY